MVLQTQQPIKTVDDFIRYVSLPENADRNLEFINGKVVEKLGNTTQNSQIPMFLSAVVVTHCDTHNIPCYLSGADGEYCIGDWCFIPDFACKQTPVSATFPDRVPPCGQSRSFPRVKTLRLNGENIFKPVSCCGRCMSMSA